MLGGDRGRFRRWALIEAELGPAPACGELCLGGARPNCSHLSRSRRQLGSAAVSPVRVRGGRMDGWLPRPESIPLGETVDAAEFPQPLLFSLILLSPTVHLFGGALPTPPSPDLPSAFS